MENSQEVQNFMSECRKVVAPHITRNFIDIVMGRSQEDKIDSYCHISCIRDLKIKNFKRSGRWAFRPIFGITEFASTIFSLETLFFNVLLYNRVVFPRIHKSPLKNLLILQYYLCNITFLASFFLHIYENTVTRYADYFSAFLSIIAGVIVVISRISFYVCPNSRKRIEMVAVILGIAFSAFHLHKMLFVEFDFVYNKIACGVLFVFCCVGDCALCLVLKDKKHTRWITRYIACLLFGGFIEILDISPIYFILDTHAVWHLMVALAVPFHTNFLAHDIESMKRIEEERESQRKEK